jgi:hypothetical protein
VKGSSCSGIWYGQSCIVYRLEITKRLTYGCVVVGRRCVLWLSLAYLDDCAVLPLKNQRVERQEEVKTEQVQLGRGTHSSARRVSSPLAIHDASCMGT